MLTKTVASVGGGVPQSLGCECHAKKLHRGLIFIKMEIVEYDSYIDIEEREGTAQRYDYNLNLSIVRYTNANLLQKYTKL